MEVRNSDELARELASLFQNENRRRDMIRAAAGVVEELGGGLEKTLTLLEPELTGLQNTKNS